MSISVRGRNAIARGEYEEKRNVYTNRDGSGVGGCSDGDDGDVGYANHDRSVGGGGTGDYTNAGTHIPGGRQFGF